MRATHTVTLLAILVAACGDGSRIDQGSTAEVDDADTLTADVAIDTTDASATTTPEVTSSDVEDASDAPACDAIACADAAGPCMRGVCTALGCRQVPDDGATCDDGRACTIEDRCLGGLCAGIGIVCDDGRDCTRDRCDETLGCVADAAGCPCAADEDCQDDNLCDGVERCLDLRCVEGTPTSCPAPDETCLASRCDPTTGGCVEVPRAGEVTCDDGLFCTLDDRCEGGACVGRARVCGDALACSVERCDDTLDRCVVDTTACGCLSDLDCQDDTLCNGVERCVDNACVAGDRVICAPSADPCRAAVCDPTTGACGLVAALGAIACDDGLACTTGDACANGACVGSARVCDDGLDCSLAACSEVAGGCTFDRSACACLDDGDCDDGNACNGEERCVDEACVPGVAVTCDASTDPCRVSRCVAASGACALVPAPGAPACDDGLYCTIDDRCQAGLCVGLPRDCADALACSFDRCDEAGDTCTHVQACECLDDDDCTAGDLCDGVERCVDNRCVAGTPVTCAETPSPCTTRRCNGATGGCDVVPVTSFTACDDGLACTVGDHCAGGACVGDARVCRDDRACSTDACSEGAGGCTFDTSPCGCLSDGDCADGNLCNGVERCVENRCLAGAAVVCAPSPNPCLASGCVPATGACGVTPRSDTTTCDDGDPCTDDDHCEAGACAGDTIACDDGNPCTADVCVSFLGCRALALDGPACELPRADARCELGLCTVVLCEPGYGDCDPAPGCETTLAPGCTCVDTPVTYYRDGDGDGVGGGQALVACVAPEGWVLTTGDCNDGDAGIRPDAPETCDGQSEDCDAEIDEGLPCHPIAPHLVWGPSHGGAEWLAELADGSILAGGLRVDPDTGATLASGFGPFIPTVYAPIGDAPASPAAMVSAWANATGFALDGSAVLTLDTGGCCNYAASHFAVAQDLGRAWFGGGLEYDLTTGARVGGGGPYPKFAALHGDDVVLYGDGGRIVKKPVAGAPTYDVTLGTTQLSHPAIDLGGSVVVSTGGNKPFGDWQLHLSPGGRLVRLAPTGAVAFDVVANAVTPPVMAGDGTIVVGTQAPPIDMNARRGALAAYTPTGDLKWQVAIGGFPNDLFVGDDQRAWVITARGQLVAVDLATGATAAMWYGLQGAREIIASGGRLVTGRGQAIDVADATGLPFITSGYDPSSPWPVPRHDNQRSGQGRVRAWADADGDGWGAGAPMMATRVGPGLASRPGDCEPGDPSVHPGATELCNDRDDDCDDVIDDLEGGAPCLHADDVVAWRANLPLSGWLAQFADGDPYVGGWVLDRDSGAVIASAGGSYIPSILSPPSGPELLVTGWGNTQVYTKDGTLLRHLDTGGCCNYPAVYMAIDRYAGVGAWGGAGRYDLYTGVRTPGAPPLNWNAFFGHGTLIGWGRGSVYGTGGALARHDFATGAVWSRERPETPQLSQVALEHDGHIVTSTGGNKPYGDWALQISEGGHVLRYTAAGELVFDAPADSVTPPVIAGDGTIVVGTQAPPLAMDAARGALLALNPDGTSRWSSALGSFPNDLFVGDDDRVYVTTQVGRLIAVDGDTGAIALVVRGLRPAREIILSAGRVFTSAGEAIDLPPGFAHDYDAMSPWPVQRHDNQRTNALITDACDGACGCVASESLLVRLGFDGDLADLSGHGRSGVATGGVSFPSSPRGQAAAFDGTGTVTLQSARVLGPTTSRSRTVSVWVDAGTTGGGQVATQYRNQQPESCSFFVAYDRGSGIIRASGKGIDVVDAPVGTSLDGWHHWVVTFASSGATRIWVDGALRGEGTLSLPSAESPFDPTVGALPGFEGSFMTGRVDELRVYDRVLTQAEIVALAGESGCGTP